MIPPFGPFRANPGRCAADFWNTRTGAEILARIIMTKWQQAGHHDVRAWVPMEGEKEMDRAKSGNRAVWTVRTNLVAGLPPSMVK